MFINAGCALGAGVYRAVCNPSMLPTAHGRAPQKIVELGGKTMELWSSGSTENSGASPFLDYIVPQGV